MSRSGIPESAPTPKLGIVAKQRIMPLSYRRLLRGGSPADEDSFLAGLGEIFGPDTRAIPIGRARMGIHLLAKMAIRGVRRRVLMSPFTIPDVVTMVVLAGAEPVFYDLGVSSTAASLESLDRLIDEKTAAVFVTHYHVNESRLPEISSLCRRHGAYLFDDCAVAFGGDIGGRLIGTLTDASVFSFSSFKLMNFFWGGLITTRDRTLAQALAQIVDGWPRLSALQYRGQAKSCLRYDLASSPPLFETLVFPLIKGRTRKSSMNRGLEHIRVETVEIDDTLTSRPSLAAFAEWAPKLDKVGAWLEHRRQIVAVYRQQLDAYMVGAGTPQSILAGSCFTNFPVLIPEARCAQVARSMILAGFDVGRALYPNVHHHPRFTQIQGESNNVDRMVASTLYLPTHFGVSKPYAEVIAGHLLQEIQCH